MMASYFATLESDGRLRTIIMFDRRPDQAPDGAVELSEAQYLDALANQDTRIWQGGALVPCLSNRVYDIPTALIVQRLSAIGKLRAARVAMKFDLPLDQLSDAELELQELWRANASISSDNASARLMLERIGLGDVGSSVDAILARP